MTLIECERAQRAPIVSWSKIMHLWKMPLRIERTRCVALGSTIARRSLWFIACFSPWFLNLLSLNNTATWAQWRHWRTSSFWSSFAVLFRLWWVRTSMFLGSSVRSRWCYIIMMGQIRLLFRHDRKIAKYAKLFCANRYAILYARYVLITLN